jgi:predicted nuclease with RNAse H fold
MFVSIDVRTEGLNCISVDSKLRVDETALVPTQEFEQLPVWIVEAKVVAVDAPANISTAPHANDHELSGKFREARCAEIALWRECGSWVPWTAPITAPPDGWMKVGLDLYDAISQMSTAEVIEIYPYAGFRELAGRKGLAKKTTIIGARERVELLRGNGPAPKTSMDVVA